MLYLTKHLTHFYLRLYGVRHMVKEGNPLPPHRLLFPINMHHPTDRIAHTTAFVTPVVEHWLEREIAQWAYPMKDRSDDPSHALTTELHLAPVKIRLPVFVYKAVLIRVRHCFKLANNSRFELFNLKRQHLTDTGEKLVYIVSGLGCLFGVVLLWLFLCVCFCCGFVVVFVFLCVGFFVCFCLGFFVWFLVFGFFHRSMTNKLELNIISFTCQKVKNMHVHNVEQSTTLAVWRFVPDLLTQVAVHFPVGLAVFAVGPAPGVPPCPTRDYPRRRKESGERALDQVGLAANCVVRVAVVGARAVEANVVSCR